jgi:NADH-quinone oxidoreductase subunit J
MPSLNVISFLVLAVASIASGIGVVAFKNAVHSALSLILTLLFVALFYLQLGAMFIAVVQILIYAGAIMVLFLFVVTMLAPDTGDSEQRDRLPWQRVAGIVLGLTLVGALSYLLITSASKTSTMALNPNDNLEVVTQHQGSIEAFGQALFHGYAFPFEITSLLIVVAILGALIFGRRA